MKMHALTIFSLQWTVEEILNRLGTWGNVADTL